MAKKTEVVKTTEVENDSMKISIKVLAIVIAGLFGGFYVYRTEVNKLDVIVDFTKKDVNRLEETLKINTDAIQKKSSEIQALSFRIETIENKLK
jgi:hypothetical protein